MEGTKLGQDEVVFNNQLSEEAEKVEETKLTATRLGEVSEFEQSLIDSSGETPKEAVVSVETVEETTTESQEDINESNFFQDAMEETFLSFEEGDIIKGIVRHVEKGGVLVDISYKSDGFVPNNEFSNDPNETAENTLNPGDPIDVYIEKLETKEGYTHLSRKRAQHELAWQDIADLVKSREQVSVYVASHVEGGLVVEYKGIKGFIPASQAGEQEGGLETLVGQTLDVAVIHSDRKRRKVIFSNRLAGRRRHDDAQVKQLMEELEVGSTRKGIVSSIKDFGAFIDIGGIEGLVHISELSWTRVSHPSELLGLGEDVDVFILGVDKEQNRVSLGMKQLQPDPWVTVAQDYKIGQKIQGTVSRTVTFGAFLSIDDKLEGLIHISELANEHIDQVTDVISPGDKVDAVIIKLLPEEQKIGLSIKRLNQDFPEETASETSTAEVASEASSEVSETA
ncbi:S1 RNA-binding domain-containing protein [bacterium]|jgi:small subunit ribosomal protein S1|nr:S1 RNA-binding domain-containing protein [bacterium]